jgi:hypothetical protein
MFAMTVTVKAMDSQRWPCRIKLFQFNGPSPQVEVGITRELSPVMPVHSVNPSSRLLAAYFPSVET